MKNVFKTASIFAAAALLSAGASSHPAVLPDRPESPKRNTHEMPTSKRSKVKARRKQSRKGRKK